MNFNSVAGTWKCKANTLRLLEEIETERQSLNTLADRASSLSDPAILAASIKLDLLVSTYYSLSRSDGLEAEESADLNRKR